MIMQLSLMNDSSRPEPGSEREGTAISRLRYHLSRLPPVDQLMFIDPAPVGTPQTFKKCFEQVKRLRKSKGHSPSPLPSSHIKCPLKPVQFGIVDASEFAPRSGGVSSTD